MNDEKLDTLSQAIEQLSDKKKYLRSETDLSDSFNSTEFIDAKQGLLIKELSSSIRILSSFIHTSHFDSVLLLLSQPFRLFFVSFCIGLLRGMGFAIGFFCLAFLIFYYLFPDLLQRFLF